MTLIYVLGAVMFLALSVVGFLFYLLNKEASQPAATKVVPIIDPSELIKAEGPSIQEVEYKKRADELEDELRVISDKGVAQAQEAMGLIDALTRENQSLKEEKAKREGEDSEQFSFLQKHAEQLRVDNSALQVQLDESHVKLQSLQEEATLIRQQMGEELKVASSAVEHMRAEKESALASRESSTQSTETLSAELADAKAANEQLLQEADGLRMTAQKLKELNAHLIEKNQLLQYELTKNRAQASGLEKICDNYRSQLSRLHEFQGKG